MKIGLIGDLHLGCRGNSRYMMEFSHDYILRKIDYFASIGIEDIILAGDITDNRTIIHMLNINFLRKTLKAKIEEHDLNVIVLAGNHDSFYKHELTITSVELLMSDYCKVVTTPWNFNDEIDIIPWVCDGNEVHVNDYLSSPSKYCVGHFELQGFQLSKNVYSKDGMDAAKLKSYTKVLSGHYHVKQDAGNIFYLGTPYPVTWTEYGTQKGVYVLDTDLDTLKFIENDDSDSLFHVVNFNTEPDFKYEDCIGKVVKCNIIEKATPVKMKKFFEEMGNIDLIKLEYIDHTEIEKVDGEVISDLTGTDLNATIQSYIKENKLSDKVTEYSAVVMGGFDD